MYYKTKPFPHQRWLVEWGINKPFLGIFDKPGSGKSKMALDVAQNREGLERIFIFCPGGLISNWKREVELHYDYYVPITYVSYGELSLFLGNIKRNKRNEKGRSNRKEGLPFKATSKDLFIFDESHCLKNPESKRTRYLMNYLTQHYPQIITMTGTPQPNDARDLFIQAFLCNLPAASLDDYLFKNNYCEISFDANGREICTGMKNEKELMAQFAKCSVFRKKSDFLDLPDKIYSPLYYEYSPEQKIAFKKLKNEAAILFETAFTEESKLEIAKSSIWNLMRLSQGYLQLQDEFKNNSYREVVAFKKSPKTRLLLDLLDTFDKKESVIIYSCLVHDVILLQNALREAGYGVRVRHGQLSREEQSKVIEDFCEGKFQILIATVQSTHAGFTLTKCSKIIYFHNSQSALEREQSEDRIHRIGQDRLCVYYDLVAKGMLDERTMNKVKLKIKTGETWIDLFKDLLLKKEN